MTLVKHNLGLDVCTFKLTKCRTGEGGENRQAKADRPQLLDDYVRLSFYRPHPKPQPRTFVRRALMLQFCSASFEGNLHARNYRCGQAFVE